MTLLQVHRGEEGPALLDAFLLHAHWQHRGGEVVGGGQWAVGSGGGLVSSE